MVNYVVFLSRRDPLTVTIVGWLVLVPLAFLRVDKLGCVSSFRYFVVGCKR